MEKIESQSELQSESQNELQNDTALSLTKEKQLQNILEAAEKCFIEQGIALTSMKDIALRAGIYRRTLYNYFQSKEEVAFAIHQKYNQNGLKFNILRSGTGYEQLEALMAFLFDHLDDLLPNIRYEIQYEFYMHHVEQNEAFIKAGMNKDLIDAFEVVLKLGAKDGSITLPEAELDMTVYSILQTLIGYLQRIVHREAVFYQETGFSRTHWDIIVRIILRGLKA